MIPGERSVRPTRCVDDRRWPNVRANAAKGTRRAGPHKRELPSIKGDVNKKKTLARVSNQLNFVCGAGGSRLEPVADLNKEVGGDLWTRPPDADGSNGTRWFGWDLKGPDSCVMREGIDGSPGCFSNIPQQFGRDIECFLTSEVLAGATG